MRRVVIVIVSFLLLINLVQAQQNRSTDTRAAPGNDNFAGALTIPANYSGDVADFEQATNEAAEPVHVCRTGGQGTGGRSIWYKFTLTHYSKVIIRTEGSSFTYSDFSTDEDTVITLRQGTAINNVSAMVCNDDEFPNSKLSSFIQQHLDPGTYYIQVSSWDNGPMIAPSTVHLSLTSTIAPTKTPTPTNTFTPTSTPSNTPIHTATSTAIPPSHTPTATETLGAAIELLGNTSFELIAAKKQPELWKAVLPTKDKIKCNTATGQVSREGLCAYVFQGSANEQAKLAQFANLEGHTLTTGDKLLPSIYYRTKGAAPRLKLKIRVFYVDTQIPVGKQNLTITAPAETYTQISGTIMTLEGAVLKVKFQLQNKAITGKIILDNASLLYEDVE